MKIVVAAVQMPCDQLDVSANLHRADDLLRSAYEAGRGARGPARAVQHRIQPLSGLRALQRDAGGPHDLPPSPAQPPVADGDRGRIRRTIAAASLRFPGFLHARRRRPDLSQAQPGLLGAVSVPPRPIAAGRLDPLGPGRLRDLRRHDLSQGLERLSRRGSIWPSFRRPGPTSPIAIPGAGIGCSATSARSRRRSRPRSPRIWASRSSSPTSVARPAPRSRSWAPRSRTGSPARAVSATVGTASRCIAGKEPALLIAPITLHQRGMKSWRSMSPSAPAASSSDSALS